MGSPEDEAGRDSDEGPRHLVTLTQEFWLGDTPCTQALWEEVMGENPSRFQSPKRPVEQVSWNDCQKFFETLEERQPGIHLALPSEAQWEFACRAGTTTATWLGDRGSLDEIAWHRGNSDENFDLPGASIGTQEVANKKPNPWGLFDMLGNVYELCRDRWNLRTPYPGEDRTDPLGEEGSDRVFRGGAWHSYARGVRAAYRFGYDPGYRDHALGFRLSRGPEPGRVERQEVEPRDSKSSPRRPAEGGASPNEQARKVESRGGLGPGRGPTT